MSKASSLLGALFLCIATHSAFAQSAAAPNAEEEAVRRQEKSIHLRKTLESARNARRIGDLSTSAKLYEEAWNMVESLGSAVDVERSEAMAGFTDVRISLAERAAHDGEYKEVDTHLSRALKVDPNNLRARNLKIANDKLLAEMLGRTPSEATLGLLPEFQTNSVKAGILVQDGRLLLEMGKLDEAESRLKAASKLNPENPSSYYYLNLVKERRFSRELSKRDQSTKDRLVEIEKAWNPPTPSKMLPPHSNPFVKTNRITTGSGRQSIQHKLDIIRLDELKLPESLSLGEVVKTLDEQARKRDPEGKGINFIVSSTLDPFTPQASANIDPATGLPQAAQAAEPVDLNAINIRLSTTLRNIRLADAIDAIVKTAEKPIKVSIEEYAVIFTQARPEPVQLYTRRFRVDPNTFMQGLESVVGQPFGDIQVGGQGGGGGGGGGGGAGGGQGGTSIYSVPRVEVSTPTTGGGAGGGGGGGGGGGVGGGVGGSGITGVSRTNLMANIQVLVRDFFRAAGVDFPQTVVPGQGGAGGGGGGGGGAFGLAAQGADPNASQKALFFNDRTGYLFVRATLSDLDIIDQAIQVLNIAPPQVTIETKFAEVTQADKKAFGFDWFLGNLLFGGGKLGGQAGSQSTLAGKPSDANPYGTFPGYPSYSDNNGPLQTLVPSTHLSVAPTDQKVTGGVRNQVGSALGGDLAQIPALGTLTGILTEPQFRVVIRAIEQRDGADLLSAPKLTTLSGRQAKIQVADIRTIVTGVGNGTGGAGGGGGAGAGTGGGGATAGGANNIFTPGSVAITYTLQAIPFGPEMDVVPYVSADDISIQMTLIPSYTEFLGYDDPGDFVPQVQAVGVTAAQPLKATLPLPHFRARSVTTSAIVWDGQTIVLGGLISEDIRKLKDKVPFLGDVPFLGRLFRSESSSTSKKNLMIFVTPTIVDPAGNRVHDPNNLPYDPNSVPPQTAASR